MKITSDYKDYYDVALGTGQDSSLVYRRIVKTVDSGLGGVSDYRQSYTWRFNRPHYDNSGIFYRYRTIGFCGKIYPLLELNTWENHLCRNKTERGTRRFCYKIEDVDEYVRKLANDTQWEEYNVRKKYSWSRSQRLTWPSDQRRITFEELLVPNEHTQAHWRKYAPKLFEKHHCPLFVGDSRKEKNQHGNEYDVPIVHLNAKLEPFEFYRVFDPYQAYQEIAMYLGSMADPGKVIPEISDEIMLQAKGFDPRFSFRKPKTSKKRKK